MVEGSERAGVAGLFKSGSFLLAGSRFVVIMGVTWGGAVMGMHDDGSAYIKMKGRIF